MTRPHIGSRWFYRPTACEVHAKRTGDWERNLMSNHVWVHFDGDPNPNTPDGGYQVAIKDLAPNPT